MDDYQQYTFVAERLDGGVVCIAPCDDFEGNEKTFKKISNLEGAEHYIKVPYIKLPSKRKFRKFWRIVGDTVKIDFATGKAYYKEKMRRRECSNHSQ